MRVIGFVRRAWFQTLVVGLALFFLLERVLMVTDNPKLIPTVIMIGAFLAPVTMVTWIYERAGTRRIPIPSLAQCFIWGGTVGVAAAALLEYETRRDLGFLPLLMVGLIEESAKLMIPVGMYIRARYRSEADGLLIGVASGMGFAALETMGYALVALINSNGNVGQLEDTLLVRGLLSPAGHGAWTGLVCAVLWRERVRAGGRAILNGAIVTAFAAAVILHALWDTLIGYSGPTLIEQAGIELLSLGVAAVSLVFLILRIREADRHPAPSQPAAT